VVRGRKTYWNVDECDATPEITIRLQFIHKRMLAPIANHQSQAQLHERDQEHERRSSGVQAVHAGHEGVAREFGE
jgi:hypothetical protein